MTTCVIFNHKLAERSLIKIHIVNAMCLLTICVKKQAYLCFLRGFSLDNMCHSLHIESFYAFPVNAMCQSVGLFYGAIDNLCQYYVSFLFCSVNTMCQYPSLLSMLCVILFMLIQRIDNLCQCYVSNRRKIPKSAISIPL